ncbi:hypothetical protein ACLOJK_013858 [Asimina triloba]
MPMEIDVRTLIKDASLVVIQHPLVTLCKLDYVWWPLGGCPTDENTRLAISRQQFSLSATKSAAKIVAFTFLVMNISNRIAESNANDRCYDPFASSMSHVVSATVLERTSDHFYSLFQRKL